MSGMHAGVQAQFRELHPKAVYVHCCGHQVNLVLVNTCKSIPEIVEFFELLESLYTCLSTSLVNHEKYKEVGNTILSADPKELNDLSATRWAAQLDLLKLTSKYLCRLCHTLKQQQQQVYSINFASLQISMHCS